MSTEETYELTEVRTTLSQEGRSIVLKQDCPDYIDSLYWTLYNGLNIGVSTYSLEQNNDVGGNCAAECSDANMKIKDLTWVTGDSWNRDDQDDEEEDNQDPGEPTWGGPATKLDDGNCDQGCTECREFWYSNLPNEVTYECYDYTFYKYGTRCADWQSTDKCMTDSGNICVNSWPVGDPEMCDSPVAECRTVPLEFYNDPSELTFAARDCRFPTDGLCAFGCPSGSSCRNSHPTSDVRDWGSPYAMCRCT